MEKVFLGKAADVSLPHNNAELFDRQKHTLDLFLEKGAISKEDYDKGLSALKEKMKADT